MRPKTIEEVSAMQLCCGCGVCAYLEPERYHMVDVPRFGRRPALHGDPLQEKHIALQACPGIRLTCLSGGAQGTDHFAELLNEWGPVLEIWEGYATDPVIRFSGSSGGAITALASYCLESEEIDGALHIVPDPDKPYCNVTVFSRDRSSLILGAGSRYAPASPCEKLKEIEKATKPCVMIGKPCDIAATQKARRLRPDLDHNLGLTIACFCAGTPSTNGTLELLQLMGVNVPDEINSIRYRGNGWPGKTIAQSKTVQKTPYRELFYEESWGEILQKHRPWRCYICPDHTGEYADIAVGDPWYRKPQIGEIGQSLILVRSEKGRQIISKAIAAGYLYAEPRHVTILPASQPNLLKTRGRLWGQLVALKLLGAPYPEYEGFSFFSTWTSHLSCEEKIKSILGTIKRILVKRLHAQVAAS